jgi:hypothetical protein
MPSFYEGDQYAIEAVEEKSTAKPRKENTTAPAGAFSASDADLSVVVPADFEDESGVMDVKLPESVVALLERSAKKLNKGLGGSEDRK